MQDLQAITLRPQCPLWVISGQTVSFEITSLPALVQSRQTRTQLDCPRHRPQRRRIEAMPFGFWLTERMLSLVIWKT